MWKILESGISEIKKCSELRNRYMGVAYINKIAHKSSSYTCEYEYIVLFRRDAGRKTITQPADGF